MNFIVKIVRNILQTPFNLKSQSIILGLPSPKNMRLLWIFSLVIVSMILITSQPSSVFAGIGDDHDADGDRYSPNEGDCDDTDPDVYPGHGCGPIEISSDVNDDVVVGPDDVVVISNSATVDGNLQVNGGTVVISESSTIKGNIESNGGTILIEKDSMIEGNVDIVVSGDGGVLEINGGIVKGNLITNGIDTLTITDSYIDGNIYSENDGSITITGNTVNGNIEILGPQSCSESSNNVNGNNSGCP